MENVRDKWAVIQDLLLEIGLTAAQARRAAVAACLPEPTANNHKRAKRKYNNRRLAAALDSIIERNTNNAPTD